MSLKKGKIYGKILLDLVLLVLLGLMYRKNAISMHFHETGGLVLCGLFLLHKALNWQWIRAVTVGIFQKKAKINLRWVVDLLLLVSMTAVLVTGLLISQTLPTAIQGGQGLQGWHYFFAAWALVLSGIHLGLHGAYLRNHLWNKLPLPERAGKAVGAVLLCLIFCLGSYGLLTSSFLTNFSRPFLSASAPSFHESNQAGFEPMGERPMGEGSMGKGGGKGMGNGQGIGRNRGEQGGRTASLSNALPTLMTYSSILGWFAVVTAFLEPLFCRRNRKTEE